MAAHQTKAEAGTENRAPSATGVGLARSQSQLARGPPKHAIVGWDGQWQCRCGDKHNVHGKCLRCQTQAPCRDYLRGACPSAAICRFPHPPFVLPTAAPTPSQLAKAGVQCLDPKAVEYAMRTQRAEQGQRVLRTISWAGDWACPCGEDCLFRDPTCRRCKRSGPCREHVRGRCRAEKCRYPHAPFDLPPNKPERMAKSPDMVVVKLGKGSVVYIPPPAPAPAPVPAPAPAPAPAAAPVQQPAVRMAAVVAGKPTRTAAEVAAGQPAAAAQARPAPAAAPAATAAAAASAAAAAEPKQQPAAAAEEARPAVLEARQPNPAAAVAAQPAAEEPAVPGVPADPTVGLSELLGATLLPPHRPQPPGPVGQAVGGAQAHPAPGVGAIGQHASPPSQSFAWPPSAGGHEALPFNSLSGGPGISWVAAAVAPTALQLGGLSNGGGVQQPWWQQQWGSAAALSGAAVGQHDSLWSNGLNGSTTQLAAGAGVGAGQQQPQPNGQVKDFMMM